MKWVGKTRSASKKVHVLDSLLSMDETFCSFDVTMWKSQIYTHIRQVYSRCFPACVVVQHRCLGGKTAMLHFYYYFSTWHRTQKRFKRRWVASCTKDLAVFAGKNGKTSPSHSSEIGCFTSLQLMIQVKDLTITQICTMYHDKSLLWPFKSGRFHRLPTCHFPSIAGLSFFPRGSRLESSMIFCGILSEVKAWWRVCFSLFKEI